MSQGSYNVPTGGSISMVSFAALMNAAYNALATQSAGASAPANGPGNAPLEFQTWFDTTNVNFPVLRFFDGVNWDRSGTMDVVNSNWLPQLGGGTATLASASTTNIGAQPQTTVTVSGTAVINSFGSSAAVGEMKMIRATGAFTLVNSSSIICPGAVNIVAASGDTFIAVYNGAGQWIITSYTYAASSPPSLFNAARTLFTPSFMNVTYSGGLFTNGVPASTVTKLDRLQVGTATVNSADSPTTTKDWLETLIANTTSIAQLASINPLSRHGVLGASRTSDFASGSGSVGVSAFQNNDSSVANQNGWAFYGEAWQSGTGAIFTTPMELDIVNKTTPVTAINPWSIVPGTGVGAAIWLASGGSRAGAQTASAALVILTNGATFDKAIVVQQGALASSTGVAMALPTDYRIAWYSTGGVLGATITQQSGATGGLSLGGVKTAANGTVGPMNLGSAGPTGANAGVQEWLVVTNGAGTTRYIPCF